MNAKLKQRRLADIIGIACGRTMTFGRRAAKKVCSKR